MKINKYFIIIGMVLLIASCSTDLDVAEINDFDVTTDATTYKVGQDIKFSFVGDYVQHVSFYTGEVQKDFEYREGRVVDVNGAGATMSFTSSVQLGTQLNQLSVLVSTDFSGDYSSFDKVKAAKWTDITSRFALGTTTAFLASGVKDISDIIVTGKPIYVAYKYVTQPQQINGLARNWLIQSFNITSLKKLNNTIPLYLSAQGDAGFRIIDQNPVIAPAKSVITSSRVSLWGNLYPNPQNTDTYSENWAVSKAINTSTVDLGPDWSIAIKGVTSPKLLEYKYKYLNPGTYKVVFVATNNSIDNSNQVVKELTLTITN